jgi:DNA-binding XRE family transcriptional regulator
MALALPAAKVQRSYHRRKSYHTQLTVSLCVHWQSEMKELRSPRHEALRKLIRLERTRAEMTQAQLAEKLGVDQKTISDIETGTKRVSALEFIALGNALGFNPGTALNRIAKLPE